MHYLGSKARHAKEIIAYTCAKRKPGQYYVEPFVGGGNVICKVDPDAGPRIANDKNRFMVALLDSLGNHGWMPPETLTKPEWQVIMKQKQDKIREREQMALFAIAATGPTFGSMWCGQWAKDEGTEKQPHGTRWRQARDAALKDAPGLRGIQFFSGSNEDLMIPDDPSIIYCDPPYKGTTDYAGSKTKIMVDESLASNNWNAVKFWKWADMLVGHGHLVYVSEYRGPPSGMYDCEDPALLAERRLARESHAALKNQIMSAPIAERVALSKTLPFDEAAARILDVEGRIAAAREPLAARWKPLWTKAVVSDFSASRLSKAAAVEAGAAAAKVEMETLFHREP